MITNFEKITAPLSLLEEEIGNSIMVIFENNPGAVISAKQLVEILKDCNQDIKTNRPNFGTDRIDGPRIRKIISYLRISKKLKNLVANSKGYYITDSPAVVMRYKKSLTERVSAINAIIESLD